MRLPIFLDTDPGIDDAAAIAAALFAPELDLQLMTTVAGNVSVEKTTRNGLQLLHFWEADVPLAQGAAAPLVRPLRDAASVHGESGMEGYDFVEHNRQPLAKPAFQAIRDALMLASEPVTLVAIGPLTNIALLLTQYPECRFNIRRLVIMGGSAGRGNFTPNAEFNIAIDPEAAALVFRSGLEIVMCGLDVTNQATLSPEYLASLPALNKTGGMLHALFSHYRSGSMQSGLRMHDLCAIAWLARPALFTLQSCYVAVETQGQFTAGTTVVDIEGKLGQPANAQVALGLDVEGFRQWVAEVFAFSAISVYQGTVLPRKSRYSSPGRCCFSSSTFTSEGMVSAMV